MRLSQKRDVYIFRRFRNGEANVVHVDVETIVMDGRGAAIGHPTVKGKVAVKIAARRRGCGCWVKEGE